MNTQAAADKLKTDARTLRRFIRQDATYRNAGSGGRYNFTDRDIPLLTQRFEAWRNSAKTPSPTRVVASPKPGKTRVKDNKKDQIPVSMLRSRDPKTRVEIRRRAEQRVIRLEESLKARGLHVSQMRDREVSA